MYINLLYCLTAFFLAILFTFRKYITNKLQDGLKISAFISSIAAVLLLYIIFSFIMAIIVPNIINKAFFFVFGISPFIIGKIAKYEKVNFYSIIQLICIIASGLYVLSI